MEAWTARSRFRAYQVAAWMLTFFAYVTLHLGRESISNMKSSLQSEWSGPMFGGDTNTTAVFLGTLDASFMGAYAVGMYYGGHLGDRYDLRYVLGGALIATAVPITLIAVGHFARVYSPAYYVVLYVLNGGIQSLVWPGVVAVMGHWFDTKHSRGAVVGLWSGNSSVGNVLADLMCAWVLPAFGWWWGAFTAAIILVGFGVAILLLLRPHPHLVNLPSLTEADFDREDLVKEGSLNHGFLEAHAEETAERAPVKPLPFLQAVLLPGVITYSLTYACAKAVAYVYFFWLPYFLNRELNLSTADSNLYASLNDVGGIVGGAVFGWLTDIARSRAVPVSFQLFMGILFIFLFQNIATASNVIGILFGLGFTIGGAGNIISGAIAADLGENVASDSRAMATVAGIIDATASAAVAVAQVAVPLLQTRTGSWDAVFDLLMALCAASVLCLAVPVYRDTIAFWRRCTGYSAVAAEDAGKLAAVN